MWTCRWTEVCCTKRLGHRAGKRIHGSSLLWWKEFLKERLGRIESCHVSLVGVGGWGSKWYSQIKVGIKGYLIRLKCARILLSRSSCCRFEINYLPSFIPKEKGEGERPGVRALTAMRGEMYRVAWNKRKPYSSRSSREFRLHVLIHIWESQCFFSNAKTPKLRC